MGEPQRAAEFVQGDRTLDLAGAAQDPAFEGGFDGGERIVGFVRRRLDARAHGGLRRQRHDLQHAVTELGAQVCEQLVGFPRAQHVDLVDHGQVSEVGGLDPAEADTPISDSPAVAASTHTIASASSR